MNAKDPETCAPQPTAPTPPEVPTATKRPHAAFEIVGGLGSIAILLAYFGLTNGWIPEGRSFHLLNLLGAFGVGLVCARKRAWSPLFLEVVWAAVATWGLVKP